MLASRLSAEMAGVPAGESTLKGTGVCWACLLGRGGSLTDSGLRLPGLGVTGCPPSESDTSMTTARGARWPLRFGPVTTTSLLSSLSARLALAFASSMMTLLDNTALAVANLKLFLTPLSVAASPRLRLAFPGVTNGAGTGGL